MYRSISSGLIAVLLVVQLVTTHSVEAILAPFYQANREIETVLRDPKLVELFTMSESIDLIQHVKDGWRIGSGEHIVFAKIVYQPQKYPGPVQFTIEWSQDLPVGK